MELTGNHSYVGSLYSDDKVLLDRWLSRLKSTDWIKISLGVINGHMSVTKVSIKVGGHFAVVLPGERWALPGLLAQNLLCMDEYVPSFQPI